MSLLREQRARCYDAAEEWVFTMVESSHGGLSSETKALWLEHLQTLYPEIEWTDSWLRSAYKRVQKKQLMGTMHRAKATWLSLFPRYPILSDGFALSLAPDQEEEISATLEQYGLVVVRVLSDEACERSCEAIFEELNSLDVPTRTSPIDRQKPWTWEKQNWPNQRKYLISDPAFHQVAFDNRTNETVHRVFSTIWGEHRLFANIDRWGIARGTKGLAFPQPDGSVQIMNREDWSLELTYHWDYNPWLFVDELARGVHPGYQALIAFADQSEESGCHLTLPGCERFLPSWCGENVPSASLGKKRRSARPQPDDPIREYMQSIPIRRGDMLVWSCGQLHSVVPNSSSEMRLHQYVSMSPARVVDPFYETHVTWTPQQIFAKYKDSFSIDEIALSDLGARLMGRQPW